MAKWNFYEKRKQDKVEDRKKYKEYIEGLFEDLKENNSNQFATNFLKEELARIEVKDLMSLIRYKMIELGFTRQNVQDAQIPKNLENYVIKVLPVRADISNDDNARTPSFADREVERRSSRTNNHCCIIM